MSNRPPGGYILIGVNDDGSLALPAGTISDRGRFDGARLGDMIRKYVEGEIHVISQFHEYDEHEIVLIYLAHHRDGLPVPMSKLGQFQNKKKGQTVVFREGDVLVREGAKNTPLRHAHWNDLLRIRDRQLRDEARADVDSLITDFAMALRTEDSRTTPVPLSLEMADDTFTEAVISHLEADSDIRLRQFLHRAKMAVTNPDECQTALNKITIVAANTLYFERESITENAIETMYQSYSMLGHGKASRHLDIITRVYILGSLAVRLQKWAIVHNVTLRPYPFDSDTYTFSSWIRHGQVNASRGNLFTDESRGMMISAARHLMSDRPSLRPDVPNSVSSDPAELASDDILLNSLCQFDILYCLIVAAEGRHNGGGYPASSALLQERADPAFELVSSNGDARRDLFPTADDREIAQAIKDVFISASQESPTFAGHWWSLPRNAETFVKEHLSEKV